jgi:hypothetical protein
MVSFAVILFALLIAVVVAYLIIVPSKSGDSGKKLSFMLKLLFCLGNYS